MDLMLFVPLAVGVVAGLIQAAKAAGMADKFAPIAEVALGIALTFAGVVTGAVTTTASIAPAAAFWAVLYGAIVGLSAGGLYTYAKAARDAAVSAPA